MKKINLLDCTLRDGGYCNNWNFLKLFINNYLETMKVSGIKYIELGFISLKKNISDDKFLNIINLLKNKIQKYMIKIY